MLKHTARFACLALLLFAASANPLTANAISSQFDGPTPYPPVPPTTISSQFDGPNPYPPVPPASCMPAPCPVGDGR
jgi:hypothetical protein